MQEVRDTELLRRYVGENSEEAFAALVTRHVNMVYSAALRKTGNPAAAEEITQAVFIILARRADKLSRHAALSGWLYQAARLTAANFLRTEIRRARREQEAYMQSLSNQTEPEVWPQIMPLLEDAMGRLNEKDRNALALRFFEGKSFQEIGVAFGASENAAKKRVAYALEKLQIYFSKRGVVSTATIIAGAISANSVQAAPAVLAKSVTAIAIAKGATASTSTLTLIKGALKLMAWTKTKTAIVAGAAALLALAVTDLLVNYEHTVHVERLQGAWEGTMQIGANTQRIVVNILKGNGSGHVIIEQVDMGVKNIPALKVAVGRSSIDFASGSAWGYHGILNKDATELQGTWTWGKNPYRMTLKRTAIPDAVQNPLTEEDCASRPGSDLQGFWKGTLKSGSASQRLYLKIAESPDGTFRVQVDSIDQPPVISLPATTFSYNKPDVTFSNQGIGAAFNGKLDDSGTTIAGKWAQNGVFPLTFVRADPKDEEQALEAGKNYDFANDTELQGNWNGTLPDEFGVKLRIILHIAQLPDGSFSAAMESPDQNFLSIPFDAAQYAPPKVRLEMNSGKYAFEGKLSGGKLSGTWTLNKVPQPLTLERNKPN